MITAGFHHDLGARRQINPLDPPHTHHAVIHQVRVNFDALCQVALRRDQTVTRLTSLQRSDRPRCSWPFPALPGPGVFHLYGLHNVFSVVAVLAVHAVLHLVRLGIGCCGNAS